MSIQNLIDELRKALPGIQVELNIYPNGDGMLCVWHTKPMIDGIPFGEDSFVKTPDEALSLLRKRLGLDNQP